VLKKAKDWVQDRFALKPIQEKILDRRVPKAPWYFGDGAALVLLLSVLVLTGAFMTLTYSPTPQTAYESVRFITENQTLGWFIRALHYWSAGVMVIMLVLHLFRQILLGGYKSPREGTWLLGVLLLFFIVAMSFVGYTLRWDERSIYAIKVVLHMFHNVPIIGEYLVLIVQGGTEVGAQTLTRLYSVHVILFPLLIFALVGFHLYLVIVNGVTTRSERKQLVHSVEEQRKLYKREAASESQGHTFHPHTATASGIYAFSVFLIVFLLSYFIGPAEIQPKANLTETAFPAEEWWFWWYSALIALLPPAIAPAFVVIFPILIFLFLALLPFLDRSPKRGMRNRPIAVVSVILVAVSLLGLTDLRRRSPWTGWPDPRLPPIPVGFQLTPHAQRGRELYVVYGCNTCHAVSGVGREVGPDLGRITPPISRDEIERFILNPPEGVAMPSYEGRLTPMELNRIVEFVHVSQTFPREP
jgi:ubiquinol-cytochrome c reductase cytochrome b subunit